MQQENVDGRRKEFPILGTDVRQLASEIYQEDDVLLSKYLFTLQGKVLSLPEAKSFLTFLRTQLSHR